MTGGEELGYELAEGLQVAVDLPELPRGLFLVLLLLLVPRGDRAAEAGPYGVYEDQVREGEPALQVVHELHRGRGGGTVRVERDASGTERAYVEVG